jgi:hypothetical protein
MKRPILILALIGLYSAAQAQSTKFEVQIKKTATTDGIDESSDDAEQQNNVMDKLFDDDLDMGWEGDDFNIVATGFRFTGVTIPKGAKIDSAYIIFFSHEEEKDTAADTIPLPHALPPTTPMAPRLALCLLEDGILTKVEWEKFTRWANKIRGCGHERRPSLNLGQMGDDQFWLESRNVSVGFNQYFGRPNCSEISGWTQGLVPR